MRVTDRNRHECVAERGSDRGRRGRDDRSSGRRALEDLVRHDAPRLSGRAEHAEAHRRTPDLAGELRLRDRRREVDVVELELEYEFLRRRALLPVADEPDPAPVIGQQRGRPRDGLEPVQRDVREIPEDVGVVAGIIDGHEHRLVGADPEDREVIAVPARESGEEVGVLGGVDDDQVHAPARQRVDGAGRERERRVNLAQISVEDDRVVQRDEHVERGRYPPHARDEPEHAGIDVPGIQEHDEIRPLAGEEMPRESCQCDQDARQHGQRRARRPGRAVVVPGRDVPDLDLGAQLVEQPEPLPGPGHARIEGADHEDAATGHAAIRGGRRGNASPGSYLRHISYYGRGL